MEGWRGGGVEGWRGGGVEGWRGGADVMCGVYFDIHCKQLPIFNHTGTILGQYGPAHKAHTGDKVFA